MTALGTLIAATLVTLPIALVQLPSHMTGWKVTASVLTLGIAGTGVAYVLYYGLISGAGASRAILITYLVPTFAVVYGAVLLGGARDGGGDRGPCAGRGRSWPRNGCDPSRPLAPVGLERDLIERRRG